MLMQGLFGLSVLEEASLFRPSEGLAHDNKTSSEETEILLSFLSVEPLGYLLAVAVLQALGLM